MASQALIWSSLGLAVAYYALGFFGLGARRGTVERRIKDPWFSRIHFALWTAAISTMVTGVVLAMVWRGVL